MLADVSTGGEYRALVSREAGDVAGVALYGPIAGSEGAAALHAAVVAPRYRRRGYGARLVRQAVGELFDEGARFVAAELADDGATAAYAALLAACGFVEEGRVADLHRDGVALRFLRRWAAPPSGR